MNIDLPYASVEECKAAGIAKDLPPLSEGIYVFCADLDCTNPTTVAWIWQSNVFVIEAGRMLMRPVTMWFPLCSRHAPLQETPDIELSEEVSGAPDRPEGT